MENLLKNWQLLKHNLEETNIRKLVKSYSYHINLGVPADSRLSTRQQCAQAKRAHCILWGIKHSMASQKR